MMYQIAKKIENIDSFKVFDKYMGFKLKGNKRLLYLNDTIVDENNRGYLFFQNSLCLHNGGKTTFLNLHTKERTEIPITFNGDIGYFQNTYISSINSKQEEDYRWTSNYVIYQLFPFEELYELPHRYYGSGYRFENQYIQIQNERTTLKSLSLLTGEYEWEVDLGEYCLYVQDNQEWQGNISHIIGVFQDILWLMCSYGRLIGLCVKTGKILGNVWLGDLRAELQNLVILNPPIVNEATKEFVFCTYKYFFTIDVKTLFLNVFHQIVFEHREDQIETQIIHNGLVYFTGKHFLPNDQTESQVGVYSPTENKILWLYSLGNTIVNQPPQVSGNKLYVLDTEGTLHIFEKEA